MKMILLVVVCTVAAGLFQVAEAQEPAVCLSGNGCVGDDLGAMLPRGCCVDTPNGRSYRFPGQEICMECTVLGFFQESFIGVEQAEPYEISVGYIKVRPGTAQTLTFTVGAIDGSASNSDYTVNVAQVTFGAAGSSVRFTLNQDNVALEPNDTFTLQLAASQALNPQFFFFNNFTVTIIDGDALNVTFEREIYFVDEDDGSVEVCLRTNIGYAEAFDAVIEVVMKGVDNPAASNSDFDSSDQTLSFTPSDSSSRSCAQISIIDDSIFEGDEQFLVRLKSLSNSQIMTGEVSEACVTIRENDIPEFNLLPENVVIVENNTEVEVCILLTTMLGRDVVVTAETGPKIGASNQATGDSDYVTVTFEQTFTPMDEASQMMCGRVQIIDDMLANEPDEQFSVFLVSATPTGVFGSNETCITIMDNDVPEFSLTPLAINVTEGNTEVQVCITMSGMIDRNVVVTAQTAPKVGASNQATAGSDYQSTTITVTFEPMTGGESAEMRCGNIRIIDDMVGEPDEQFSVRLISANPTGNFSNDETCVTIVDNDSGLVCHENANLVEGPNGMPMCVCRKGYAGDGVTNCTDIDECKEIKDICDMFVSCTKIGSSYTCQCTQEDGLECLTRDVEDTPDKSTRGKKTKSRTTKSRTMSSGSGHTTRSKRSRSTHPHSTRPHSTRPHSTRSHSRMTKCTPKQRKRGQCGDIDMCGAEELNDCNSYVQCENLPGSFKCVCTDCIIMDEELTTTKSTKRTKSSKMKTKSKSPKTPKTPKTPK